MLYDVVRFITSTLRFDVLQLPNTDLKSKVVAASELRDAVDTFQSSPADYEYYLQKMMPVYTKILESTPVSFTSISVEQVSMR